MKFPSYVSVLLVSFGVFSGAQAAPSARDAYYCKTYAACRAAFREAAKPYAAQGETGEWRIPSRTDGDLTTDYLYLPAKGSPRNLLVLTSGVHGVEGFAGSAIQRLFLAEILPKLDRQNLGVLVVHGINPFGMKYLRRVSENNVDLNRNFDVDTKLFETRNEGYRKLVALLNPQTPATSGTLTRVGFYYKAIRALTRDSLKTLREAVLAGQYEYPTGLYFGGKQFEPQKKLLEDALLDRARAYHNVLVLDLHTGYGKKGVMHLFASPYETPEVERLTKALFAGYPIDEASSKDFYANSGDFSVYVTKLLLREKKQVIPMTLEYGTFDNQSYYGSIESLRRMINENQLHHHGAKGSSTATRIRSQFMELYFPDNRGWRERIMETSARWIPVFLERFRQMP